MAVTAEGEPMAVTSTDSRRREPNFFMVGASRAGTTSLWHYLKQHPDVYLASDPKEPSHFCDLTPSWAHKYREPAGYMALFDGVENERAIGDASTTYLPSPESPGRIRARFPDAKIVITLRNPADRAYSLYTLLCQLGFEELTPFERALAEEDARTLSTSFRHDNPFWFYAYQYFRSGLYADQIERYQATFPADRIKIVLFDALRQQPVETTQEIYAFLGVDPTFKPKISVRNRSQFPFSVPVQYAVVRRWRTHPLKSFERRSGPLDWMSAAVFVANLILGGFRARRFDPATRADLLRRYAPDIRRTADLIGMDLEPWIYGREISAE